MSSTKSMTGHLLGAAGGLEAGITALAVQHQIAAADDQSRRRPIPGCDLDYVPHADAAAADALRALELVRLRRHQRASLPVQEATSECRLDGLNS